MRLKRIALILILLIVTMAPAVAQYRQKYPLPTAGVPGSLGVNIHFNDPRTGEMEQLAAAGFRWIRMDFTWGGIERVRGQYDFAAQDRLMAHLDRHKIRPIFILDYGNDLYQEGSPRTGESRAAFARFAAASVTHFKGRGILWEMWNEPNGGFWKPKANVDEYIALALATGKAIREAAPEEWYIGPGVSGMDFTFIESCLRAGLLKYWDAVSFHPYRNSAPETAAEDFHHLRALVARYSNGRSVPLINSEWGYSEKYPGLNLEKQSKYIARQALIDVASGLRVSIWYDWHDDGVDPKEEEHHFGTVYNDYRPKPTYQAISTLTHTLADCRFNKRLALESATDYCLLFTSSKGPRLAVWTTSLKPHAVRIPASPGTFKVVDFVGAAAEVTADTAGLPVTLTDAPQYLVPAAGNALLETASRWKTLEDAPVTSPKEALSWLTQVTAGNWDARDRSLVTGLRLEPSSEPGKSLVVNRPVLKEAGSSLPLAAFLKTAELPYNSETPVTLRASLLTAGAELSQILEFTSSRPLRIVAEPAGGGKIPIRIENPTGQEFEGRIHLTGGADMSGVPLKFKQGQTEQTVNLPVTIRQDGSYAAGVRIETPISGAKGSKSWITVNTSPDVEFRPLEGFAAYSPGAAPPASDYRVLPDGDPKVNSTIQVNIARAPAGLFDPQTRAIRIDYDFQPGWKFLRLQPEGDKRAPLSGTPFAFGAWVYGDGSGDVLNARYTDASGQTFQPTAGSIDWRGWRFVTFSLRGDNSGHWSGAGDGIIHYPIHLDTLLLIDSPGGRGGKGTVYATGFTLMEALKR